MHQRFFYIIYFLSFSILIKAQTDTISPAVPQGVQAFGYEKNIELDWFNNTESDLAGYKIYRWNGSEFTYLLTVPKKNSFLVLNIDQLGIGYSFKISAYDYSNNESALSDSVEASTHEMTNDEFLDMVQRSTFRYFWDWADPVSGIARERWHPDELDKTNTTGGGGFGVMTILVGIERGFITREQGAARMLKITDFLDNKIDRFHGAFPHWFNGTTGTVINFGNQDGGDIVETAFMIEGLLAARQYFNQQDSTEQQIRNYITQLWEAVDWEFYRNYSGGLYWNWSLNNGFDFIFHGWSETLMPYLLAIASPTESVNVSAPTFYKSGWGNNGSIYSLRTVLGYQLYVGSSYGGPLFFTHYSFLGFDPRNKKDFYTNYFTHNRNQTLVNRQYCINNVNGYVGYGPDNWGLTASYSIPGEYYKAHAPGNDNGTIAPTAALSSMPYTPEESIAALKHFYRTYGSDLWGNFGFKDAFNLTYSSKDNPGTWFSDGYLAIDQGPIIVMIENYRSGLLWNLFMSVPEIQNAISAIGFTPDSTTDVGDELNFIDDFDLMGNYPNPFNPGTTIAFNLPSTEKVTLTIFNCLGEKIRELINQELPAGENKIYWDGLSEEHKTVGSGIYLYQITSNSKSLFGKMILQK